MKAATTTPATMVNHDHAQHAEGLSVLQVADEFIRLSRENDKKMTNLLLHKLVYFAQAYSLAMEGKPMFKEKFEAGKRGPIVRDLFYKTDGDGVIRTREIKECLLDGSNRITDARTREIIDLVYRQFGDYNPWTLVKFTLLDGQSWGKTYLAGKKNIPDQWLAEDVEDIVKAYNA